MPSIHRPLGALLLTAAAGLAPVATQAAAALPALSAADYAHAHQLVDVGHGRRLNLFCAGSGSPTVVFEAGMGNAGWDWLTVHPAIARATRACVYDRAGFGFSDAADRAGTSANEVEDLHTLLTHAGVKPPYVLVGHSHGGRNVQLYAYAYPKDVAGLVIVDSEHEDAFARADRVTGGKMSQLDAEERAMLSACVKAAHEASPGGAPAHGDCLEDGAAFYGPVLWPVVRQAHERVSFWDAIESEQDHYNAESAAQLRAARKPFGDLPLVYLTRGVSPYAVPGQPQSALNKAYEDDTLQSHEEIVRLSTRGVDYVVPGAAHNIQKDRPQAVIDAVLAVIAQLR